MEMQDEFDSNAMSQSVTSSTQFKKLTATTSPRQSADKIEEMGRKRRSCCQMLSPILVFIFVILCAYSFYIVDIFPTLDIGPNGKRYERITSWYITNWSVYGFLLFMVLWSMVRMVFSSPGYVPKNYMYDEANMQVHDVLILRTLRHALNQTQRQMIDGLDSVEDGSIRGSKQNWDFFSKGMQYGPRTGKQLRNTLGFNFDTLSRNGGQSIVSNQQAATTVRNCSDSNQFDSQVMIEQSEVQSLWLEGSEASKQKLMPGRSSSSHVSGIPSNINKTAQFQASNEHELFSSSQQRLDMQGVQQLTFSRRVSGQIGSQNAQQPLTSSNQTTARQSTVAAPNTESTTQKRISQLLDSGHSGRTLQTQDRAMSDFKINYKPIEEEDPYEINHTSDSSQIEPSQINHTSDSSQIEPSQINQSLIQQNLPDMLVPLPPPIDSAKKSLSSGMKPSVGRPNSAAITTLAPQVTSQIRAFKPSLIQKPVSSPNTSQELFLNPEKDQISILIGDQKINNESGESEGSPDAAATDQPNDDDDNELNDSLEANHKLDQKLERRRLTSPHNLVLKSTEFANPFLSKDHPNRLSKDSSQSKRGEELRSSRESTDLNNSRFFYTKKQSMLIQKTPSGVRVRISGEMPFSLAPMVFQPENAHNTSGTNDFMDTDGSEITLNEQQFLYIQKKFMSQCQVGCWCAKPPRTHHCSTCGRCVLRMDHHCKWLANCVGLKNTKFFLNFTLYMSIFCMYNLIVISDDGFRLIMSIVDGTNSTTVRFWIELVLVTAAWGLSFFVSAFCVCQLINQLQMIKHNTSFVDNLQQRQGNLEMELDLHQQIHNPALVRFQQMTYFERLVAVFGDENVLWWFVPVYRLNDRILTVENELNQFCMR